MPRQNVGIPRGLEVLLALALLTLAAPILAMAALAIGYNSPGPTLFCQKRIGLGGKPFTLYKLRTMFHRAEGPDVTARDDPRMTPLGRILRKLKVDEIPQLWNVLVGDMSLVGPRPEVPHYINLDDPLWQEVLSARPGLTDPVTLRLRNEEELLASVQGDREVFYREHLQPYKLRGYKKYLSNRSWQSDFSILWRTLWTVLFPGRTPAPSLQSVAGCEEYERNKENFGKGSTRHET